VCQATYHLRLSGFLTGQGTIAAEHPLGGVVTLNSPAGTGMAASFVAPTAVCWHGLPNKAAQQIDVSYDDGRATTGSMQGSANYTTLTATLPDTPSAAWTCMTNWLSVRNRVPQKPCNHLVCLDQASGIWRVTAAFI
jgi:hypothetical protein